MKTKFTPGSWRLKSAIKGNDGKLVYFKVAGSHKEVCGTSVYVHKGSSGAADKISDEECTANAHLIAAAPELYEALEKCRTALGQLADRPVHYYLDIADAALKKARGE